MTSEQDFPPATSPETPTSSQPLPAESASQGAEDAPRPRRRAPRRATPAADAASGAPDTTGIAENAPSENDAPKRGRPRGRGRSAHTAETAPAAPGETAPVAPASPAEAEKPARSPRRSRRPQAGDEPAEGADTGAQAEAPAPRRRGRPKKSAPGAEISAPAEGGDEGALPRSDGAEPEGAPKPASKPRRGRPARETAAAEAPASLAEAGPGTGDAAVPEITAAEGPDPETGGAEAAEGGEPARRKSRRGRRGGRGRGHKNRAPEGQNDGAEAQEPGAEAAPEALDEGAPAESSAPADGQDAVAAASDAESRDSGSAQKSGAKKPREKAAPANKRMFISVLPGEQVEVALTENGVLLEYYLDMLHQRKLKGNIYKGVIHNIDANLQAAFVNYGTGKNGFLQIDEVHPEYWLAPHEPAKGKKFPPIQKVLKPGQEVLVQVVKEPTGNKGAFLTTWLSLAGRFLVLTPGQEQIGVSRKVNDEEERARLREMMNGIDPGSGLGVIVRTVSAGTTKATLKNDLQYLKRLWKDIRKKATEVAAPALVHQEPGLSERAVRDYLTEDVGEIWVDNEAEAENVRGMVSLLFPRKKDLVRLYDDFRQSLWDRFNLRRQLEQIYSREVVLPSGGRLVFDQTEALMAVDINSGKISGKGNFEAMAFKTNMEAAEAIARHLRLRDIGGQVVIDFIEMRDKKHVVEVEKTLRQAMKNDRARHDVARMSSFGLLELVRQRMGSSALSITLEPCPACGGTGLRRNLEWRALQALRDLRGRLQNTHAPTCVFETERELGLYLLNHKRDTLRDMEQLFGKCLEISIQP
ncbi:MAG: Rne/Rng family ribonuclease [Desulfovibrio sp.]|nr:Rne/Rng family ribonuclease [Desulfovibrio sp.]